MRARTPPTPPSGSWAEELGITGVALAALPHSVYDGVVDGGRVRYHAFLFETRWDGPLLPEPTEISWVGWVTVAELVERLADPARWPFAPDGRAGVERWLAARATPRLFAAREPRGHE